MNTYTALKAFNGHVAGDVFTADERVGAKLIKQGLALLTDEYDNEQVQLRWKNECLEVYNRRTGAVLLRILPTGVQGPLTIDIVGDVTGDVDGDVTGQLFGDVTTYVADGAIGLNLLMALLNGVNATCAMTLADGTEGQTMTIKCTNITNACSVTPAHFADGTSINLLAVGDAVTLMFDGTNWHAINLYGTAAIAA